MTRAVSQAVGIPVIASGGAGKLEHFYDAFVDWGGRRGAGGVSLPLLRDRHTDLKQYLRGRGVSVRLV